MGLTIQRNEFFASLWFLMLRSVLCLHGALCSLARMLSFYLC